jgi:Cu/Ag efflux protein CusF
VKDGEQVVVAANFLIDAESNLKAAVGGFGHAAHGAAPKTGAEADKAAPAAKGSGHQAEGTVDSIDAKAGTVSIIHGPVASLKWPAMTMKFKAANETLLQALTPGAKVILRVRRTSARRMGDHCGQAAGGKPRGRHAGRRCQPARRSLTDPYGH